MMKDFKPMLAHTWEEKKNSFKMPAFVQPKIDGIRCYAVLSTIRGVPAKLYTRNGKEITSLPTLTKALSKIRKSAKQILTEDFDLILDGELHLPGANFQETVSIVKRKQVHEMEHLIAFTVFDCWSQIIHDRREGYAGRRWELENFVEAARVNPSIFGLIPTIRCESFKEITDVYKKHLKHGYEGVMIKDLRTPYEFKRSNSVLKLKPFDQDRFTVCGWNEGTGKLKNAVGSLNCMIGEKCFKVKLKMPEYKLRELRDHFNAGAILGGYDLVEVDVQYQQLTAGGIPRFPIGLELYIDGQRY